MFGMRIRWWRDGGDIALAVALFVLSFVPGAAGQGVDLAELPDRPLDALGVVLLLAQCLPVAVRRRWPATCLAVVGGAFAAFQLLRYPTAFGSLAVLVVLYSAGAHHSRVRTIVPAALAYTGFAVALEVAGSPGEPMDYVVFGAVLAVCWTAGAWTRRVVERQQLAEEAIVVAERARIARELHDVVTHHVTAMVVQADAARYRTGDELTESLSAIGSAGRHALTDLRYLLDVLHGDGEVARPTGSLPDLVAHTRAAGQPVEFVERGAPRPLATAAEVAAFRVVQEALTNAVKHAAGRPTVVEVDHGEDWLDLSVTTAGGGSGLGRGSGRGLVGLRERVTVVGGDLTAGPGPDGGFRVRARIPVRTA